MPLYEYRCRGCHQVFEVLQDTGAGARGVDCPECGGRELEKLLSVFAPATGNGAGRGAASVGEPCGSPGCPRAHGLPCGGD
jgi:putative FmdB family regulatory protein